MGLRHLRVVAALVVLSFEAHAQATTLEKGIAALDEFRRDEAIELLERARAEGPYRLADHASLYEQLGIAYAYDGRENDALAAFDRLLALVPTHVVSYSLSPKVTLLFERAKRQAAARASPMIDLAWTRDLTVTEPLVVDVDVVSDPLKFFKAAKLLWRLRGAPAWQTASFAIAQSAMRQSLRPVTEPQARDETVELKLVALDARGNEVLETVPREVTLRYRPPATPWYLKWQVLVPAAVVVATVAAVIVYFAARPPSSTVDIRLDIPQWK